jgi:hypothetical protein
VKLGWEGGGLVVLGPVIVAETLAQRAHGVADGLTLRRIDESFHPCFSFAQESDHDRPERMRT